MRLCVCVCDCEEKCAVNNPSYGAAPPAMTDSESDAGIIHVRNRLLELMYSTDAVFSVDQLARILGVDESRVLHELRHSHVHDVVYDPVDGTVRVRKQQRAAAQSDGGGGGGG
ncbi:hypothetical protein DQ04_10651000, partial [Trypanosoma grayi]|uniref:hypothetical protein n=1 Tax=Trypanosoma grayi TaxID=71804 RepID=UPI0004F4A184